MQRTRTNEVVAYARPTPLPYEKLPPVVSGPQRFPARPWQQHSPLGERTRFITRIALLGILGVAVLIIGAVFLVEAMKPAPPAPPMVVYGPPAPPAPAPVIVQPAQAVQAGHIPLQNCVLFGALCWQTPNKGG